MAPDIPFALDVFLPAHFEKFAVATFGEEDVKAFFFEFPTRQFRDTFPLRALQDSVLRFGIKPSHGDAARTLRRVVPEHTHETTALCFRIDARKAVPRAFLRFAETGEVLAERHNAVPRLQALEPR